MTAGWMVVVVVMMAEVETEDLLILLRGVFGLSGSTAGRGRQGCQLPPCPNKTLYVPSDHKTLCVGTL